MPPRISPRSIRYAGQSADVDDPLVGDAVRERMDIVRTEIDHIRANWNDYPLFMRALREFLDAESSATKPSSTAQAKPDELLQRLLAEDREWIDSGRRDSFDLSAVQLYTSESGYQSVFGRLNDHLRQPPSPTWRSRLRTLVFLVELLNIDLFNLVIVDETTRDFNGTVHRGFSVDPSTASKLLAINDQPAGERYWSIPLALMSTSRDNRIATMFAAEALSASESDRVPVSLSVNVGGISTYWLDHYATSFPESVVTSLCAVPLRSVSAFPDEDEVLLRGPFFEVLSVAQAGGGLTMKAVMSNANRDHPSSSRFSTKDGSRARQAMALMSREARCRLAVEMAESNPEIDGGVFRARQAAIEVELEQLFGSNPPAGRFDRFSMRGRPIEYGPNIERARLTYKTLVTHS